MVAIDSEQPSAVSIRHSARETASSCWPNPIGQTLDRKMGSKRRNSSQLIENMVVDGFKRLTKDFYVPLQTVKGGRGEDPQRAYRPTAAPRWHGE